MQNQMAGQEEMRNPRHADGGGDDDGDYGLLRLARIERRRGLQQQLLDSGRACMLLGALVLLAWEWDYQLIITTLPSSNSEHVLLAAFVLRLLGAALATLSLVDPRRFPRLAVAVAALVTALRNYLLGRGACL